MRLTSRARRLAVLTTGAATALTIVVGGLAPTTSADEFQPDTTSTTIANLSTATVNITLVATDDAGWNGDDQPQNRCNLRDNQSSPGRAHYVVADVTSSVPTVATVSPETISFDRCGETKAVTITAHSCGATTLSVIQDRTQGHWAGGDNAVFSDAYITVTVNGCNGGQPPVTTCAEPAAPAWANAILKANTTKGKTPGNANTVSQVAAQMLPGAAFPDWRAGHNPATQHVAKVNQAPYADAVHAYMTAPTSSGGLGLVLPKGPALSARPGWTCTTTTS